MNRVPRFAVRLTATAATLVLGACASTTPTLDTSFGLSVREARTAQTLNPQASAQNRAPVLGVDGKVATEAQKRYVDSFKAPPPTFNVINIGGAITGD
ncbi:MAG: hypothetical protein R3E94_05315 [Burkholderiaceae bacterium]